MLRKKPTKAFPGYSMRFLIVSALVVFISATVFVPAAHQGKKHETETALPGPDSLGNKFSAISGVPVAAAAPETSGTMGFDEREGAFIPAGLVFVNEQGDSVRPGEVIKGPTILSLVYFKCPNECGLLLSGIAKALQSFADKPETVPNVITLSIGDDETPADAVKARSIAFASLPKEFPADRWHFLIGPKGSVKKLADGVGFHFVKKGDDYDHPLGIIILSPKGKVVRYITGTDFLPVEIKMSLMEASSGTVQPAIARVLKACFSIDPKSHQLVFNILQVSATVIFSLLGLFIVYLVVSGKSRRKGVK